MHSSSFDYEFGLYASQLKSEQTISHSLYFLMHLVTARCFFGSFSRKKSILVFITKFVVIFLILALFGILSTIHLVAAIQPSQKYSSTIIHALETVLNRFYRTTTPTIFLTAQSSLTKSNGPNPYEMVGDLMRLKSKRIKMAYVVGNKIPDRYSRTPRFHNIFIVDSYESFR